MRLKFERIGYQEDALDAICGVFAGNAAHGVGANRLHLDRATLAANLSDVQARFGIEPTVLEGGTPHLSVEMETGTGKTFVYLAAMRRLFREAGFRKFVIVVPSVAIREGVLSAAEACNAHLGAQYGLREFETRVHRRQSISRLRAFAEDPHPQALIVNVQAFDKDANLLNRPHDDLSGRRPIEFLQAARPVVILDEPQNLEGPKARAAIEALQPLCTLRFSATHRRRHHLLFRLGPAAAHAGGWVKSIEVDPVEGDDRDSVMREQLRRTVEAHFEREREFAGRTPRIKVLSLVFIDRVAHYADADGKLRRWFEEAYEELRQDPRFTGLDLPDVGDAHGGYFARDRKHRARDTSGKTAADEAVYELILRQKERLLHPDEPLRFVFSHSALREGWDNPNVFQLCTLNESRSGLRKRQEIGRGLRLAVGEDGARVKDPAVNRLTVVANEAYDAFARALQGEVAEETGDRFDGLVRRRGEAAQTTQRGISDDRPLPDRDELVRTACEALRGLPPLEPVDWSGPMPDLLNELQRRTGLTRGTLRDVLLDTRLEDAINDPSRFLRRVVTAVRQSLPR